MLIYGLHPGTYKSAALKKLTLPAARTGRTSAGETDRGAWMAEKGDSLRFGSRSFFHISCQKHLGGQQITEVITAAQLCKRKQMIIIVFMILIIPRNQT